MRKRYILYSYTESCLAPNIIGVYTSKTKLISAIKKNADLLGLDDCEGFRCACRDMFGQLFENVYDLAEYLVSGDIAEVDASEIIA